MVDVAVGDEYFRQRQLLLIEKLEDALDVAAQRRAAGRPIAEADCQIAAIARALRETVRHVTVH